MPFGQSPGPPASARQLRELLDLLRGAGHTDFRDARGPMGFTQRQAGGRFARHEAQEFIDRLQEGGADAGDGVVPVAVSRSDEVRSVAQRTAAPPMRLSDIERTLRSIPAEDLAIELRRRGWTVVGS